MMQKLFTDEEFLTALTTILLPGYLPTQRWFTSKGKEINECTLRNFYGIMPEAGIALVDVDFTDGSRESYQMPLAITNDPTVRQMYTEDYPKIILGEITGTGLLADAVPREDFRARLYELLRHGAEDTELQSEAGRVLKSGPETATSTVPAIDTSNTAIIYADRYFFKLFRKLDAGINPDLELVRFLSEHTEFTHCPPYGGSLGVGRMDRDDYLNLGLMSGKVDNHGDAWELFQKLTANYFRSGGEVDEETLARVRLLAVRTAQMHKGLASAGSDRDDLVPEPMTAAYRGEITDAAKRLLDRQFTQLAAKLDGLPPETRQLATSVLAKREVLSQQLGALKDNEMSAQLTRIHGDYHLGQVLYTDDDFYIIDFEGEPLLTIPERRRKRPPLKDVGGMVRSFHYAAYAQILLNAGDYAGENLTERADHWFRTTSGLYLETYFRECTGVQFLPQSREDRMALTNLFILEKAVYEVAYELNSRPAWLGIPLRGVLSLV